MKNVVSTDRNLLKYFFQEYFAKKKKNILQIQLLLEFITLFGRATIKSKKLCSVLKKKVAMALRYQHKLDEQSKENSSYL